MPSTPPTWTSPIPFTADGGYHIVSGASGTPAAAVFAYQAAARGGRIVQIGTLLRTVQLPANLIMSKELTVYGSLRCAHVYPQVLETIRSGRIDLSDIMISAVTPSTACPKQ